MSGAAHQHDKRIYAVLEPFEFQADGEIPYDGTFSLCVPDTPGVYLFFDLRGPLYIGRSNNLRRRFNEHNNTHNHLLAKAINSPVGTTRYAWVTCAAHETADLEARLIDAFVPVCNVMLNNCGTRPSGAQWSSRSHRRPSGGRND